MAAIGQVIDDKYEILKLIGQGGMSKVYLAMDKRLNKQWAVKEIEKRARDRNNEIVIQSAIAEANLIKHPFTDASTISCSNCGCSVLANSKYFVLSAY